MEEAIKTVGGIGFCVFSPSEVRKYSTVEITVPETYDEDGMPVQGGLMDSRLGVLEPGQKCGTCGNTSARCPGHFGHIELAEPVLHVAFVTITHTLLVATCRSCGRVLLPEDEVKAYREQIYGQGIHDPQHRRADFEGDSRQGEEGQGLPPLRQEEAGGRVHQAPPVS